MPASVLEWGATFVIVAQIAVPLLLAWPAWKIEGPPKDSESVGGQPSRGRRRRRQGTPGGASAPRPAARAALSCTRCHAPLPLLAASFPCPSCGSPTTPPAEYAGALVAAAKAEKDLARAERVWRWSRVTSSMPFVWAGRILVVGWLGVVVAAGVVLGGEWPGAVLGLAAIVAIVQVFFGLAVFGALRSMKAAIPPLPARAEMKAPAEVTHCLGCTSPLAFVEDRFSSVCGYCTAVQYRRALAEAAHAEAKGAEAAAARSLFDGVRALEEKRVEMAGGVALTGIAVVFYAVVFLLVAAGSWLGF